MSAARNSVPGQGNPSLSILADRVANSRTFARSERHRQLLLFLADRPADAEWKEVVIGHLFFGRAPDYDPKLDPIVRTEVRRLRTRIEQYYDEEGRQDEWRLEIPKGGYTLVSKPARRR